MKSELLQVKAFTLSDRPRLDSITVFYQDFEPGKGQITIICYGEAWTAYWNAMGKRSILKFFAECDNDYLVNRLTGSQFQKNTKGHEVYLGRIVTAIKEELKEEVPTRMLTNTEIYEAAGFGLTGRLRIDEQGKVEKL